MSRVSLAERLAALDAVVAEGDGRLAEDALAQARQVREKAAERLARGDDVVVAALCGGTGGGKSSLFNALAGADLAPTGVRRPTTADARALAVGDPAATGALCDWLGVAHRHHVEATRALPDGLVLLDLPDTDSVAAAHRLLAARFVERVDLLVWVTDPLKYAHRSLHDAFLRRLATHAEVTVVVLNRSDELSEADLRTCLDDLRRLLAAEGLADARVLATSARTGDGVDDLRRLLADETRQRRAAAARITADVRATAAALRDQVGAPPDVDVDEAALVAA
ncbi:MAG TPA: GTPase, partial [Egibacteraceae bacterium]